MSVQPRHRALTVPAVAVLLTSVLLGISLGQIAPPTTTPALFHSQSVPGGVPCPGAELPHNYSGTVVVNGQPNGSSVALSYSYAAVVTTNLTSGVVLSSVCSSENGTIYPGQNGSFALSIDPVPRTNCTIPDNGSDGQCVSVEGPYELVSLAPSAPLPPGYFPSIVQNGTTFRVGLYSYLARLSLTPSAPTVTFSPGALDRFQANPWTGAGTPTPMVPQYDWTLDGVGWTFAAPPVGPFVNVTAAPGAGIGNLSVVGTLPVTGGTLTTPSVSVELLSVSTMIGSADLERTVMDVGQSATVEVNATGAAGYTYRATLQPGLGAPPTVTPCTASAAGSGGTALSCVASWNYTSVGIAQPVVTVSNGFSTATWQFPDVTVNPAPAVSISPATPAGYANATLPLVVQVASGTGTAPFQRACLVAGSGPIDCIDSAGPTWSFTPEFASPGRYSVSAWTVDGTGVNRSVNGTARIVAPLSVSISSDASAASIGTPLGVSALVLGGDLPARIWWNASGGSGSATSPEVSVDGSVGSTFYPSAVGVLSVSVTVVDSLGTVVSTSEVWAVGPGTATSVVPDVLPATSSIRTGMPLAIDWQALDAAGEAVYDFAPVSEIRLALGGSVQNVAGWVNASGLGPLPGPLPGWFDVPSAAWIGGSLNVTVTVSEAGPVDIGLIVTADLPGGADVVHVIVLPNVDQLRLSDPVSSPSGARANDTLWQVTDRFGNPAPGASVVLVSSFDGVSERTVVPVLSEPDGATEVWVNVSAPNIFAGTVTVSDLAGDLLLAPIEVPGIAGPWTPFLSGLALPIGVASGAGIGVVALRRSRRIRRKVTDVAGDDESALQRLAEGRAKVEEIVRRAGSLDLAGIAVSWEPAPAPPDLADWVASLLTDGTLDATFGGDGTARFCLSAGQRAPDRVVLDVDAFERAERRRDEARAEWERDDA